MPATLWDAAVSAARQDRLYSTARRLRIDYGALKHHLETAGRGPALAAPIFVNPRRTPSRRALLCGMLTLIGGRRGCTRSPSSGRI
jgi:hypothetical protein